MVDEPSADETIQILQGVKKLYEEHHQLLISQEAIDAAVSFSTRYITDRFLPDKAIDLIDEAASRVRMYKSPEALKLKEVATELRGVRADITQADEEGAADVIDGLRLREMDLRESLQDLRSKWGRKENWPTVTDEDVAEVVGMWTGIPVTQIAQEESFRLLQMEKGLHERIIARMRQSIQFPKRSGVQGQV